MNDWRVGPVDVMMRGLFLKRVCLRNYKSIAECDITLGPFTLLVGRNGSGKSNFLDALRLVSDALETSLDHALKSRGGIAEVRRISTGHPRNFRGDSATCGSIQQAVACVRMWTNILDPETD